MPAGQRQAQTSIELLCWEWPAFSKASPAAGKGNVRTIVCTMGPPSTVQVKQPAASMTHGAYATPHNNQQ